MTEARMTPWSDSRRPEAATGTMSSVVALQRNFGQTAATQAGIDTAIG